MAHGEFLAPKKETLLFYELLFMEEGKGGSVCSFWTGLYTFVSDHLWWKYSLSGLAPPLNLMDLISNDIS